MNIYDRARKLAAKSGVTFREALAELGRRGGIKRQAKRPKKQPVVSYWWQRD